MGRLKKLVLPGLLVAALYFVVFGGEYTVFELYRTRSALEEERARVAELRRQIDSLEARADSLENDPETLERLARERYGMIREGETLYRFADGDSVRPDSTEGR